MGALTDFQAVKASIQNGRPYCFAKNSLTGANTRLMSYWGIAPNAGATPSTAAACNASTAGALLQEPKLTSLTNSYFLTQAELAAGPITSGIFSSLMLIDRLSHQGGLNGTSAVAQTTNLPTAALTRYTSGEGVMAALEIYSAVGSTATTATISYTNQAGVSGRISKPVVFGGSSESTQSRFIPIPLQDDDTGVQSVQSVTLTASTASAGNFGITLFRPLMLFPNFAQAIEAIQPRTFNTLIGGFGCCPEILDDACLGLLGIANSTNVGVITGALYLAEA